MDRQTGGPHERLPGAVKGHAAAARHVRVDSTLRGVDSDGRRAARVDSLIDSDHLDARTLQAVWERERGSSNVTACPALLPASCNTIRETPSVQL